MPRIDATERWVGGVAAAIARELGVEPLIIRVSFGVLSLAGAWGVGLYLVAWLTLAVAQPGQIAPYQPMPKAATPRSRHLAIAMIVLGLLLLLRNVVGFYDQIVWPTAFVVTGFLIAWTRQRSEGGTSAVIRILAGVSVGVGGMIAFILQSANVVDAVLLLVVSIAIIGGIALVATPSLTRIGRDLDRERQDRVRADERARVAAHLHDSVLQTLALIQRHANDPGRTAQLARHQERELRSWLYGTGPTQAASRLQPALELMAAEVDETHGIPVKVIAVADNTDLESQQIELLVAAAKEATVNAAKHSGANKIDVFAERKTDRIEVFVRDTGCGFDPNQTKADRRGISESIMARMERAGGTAAIFSQPGEGTEVELILPISADEQPIEAP